MKVERNKIKASGVICVIVSSGKTSLEFKMMIIDLNIR